MRHIDRSPKPRILQEKEVEWLNKFLGSGKKRPDYRCYAHKDIIEALKNMSYSKCFYSEISLKTGMMEVDHLIEVSVDKYKAFDWDNLYLSFHDCNNGRPNENAIPSQDVLNPCIDSDEEIQKHLTFVDDVITAANGSEKGFKTIRKYKLDTDVLELRRSKHINHICKEVVQIQRKMFSEGRKEMTDEEKAYLKAYANRNMEFSLMSEIFLKKNVPELFN